MSVLHDFECAAHGRFEKRVQAGVTPRCPKGCSPQLVTLIFLQPVGTRSARTRSADRLLREAADMQGLSDISTSPSRPGGSVAERNRMKLRGPKGREYPELMAAKPVDFGQYIGAMTMQDNALTRTGFGHGYNKDEWHKDKDTGALKHVGAQGPIRSVPTGSTGVSVERVKEKPK